MRAVLTSTYVRDTSRKETDMEKTKPNGHGTPTDSGAQLADAGIDQLTDRAGADLLAAVNVCRTDRSNAVYGSGGNFSQMEA